MDSVTVSPQDSSCSSSVDASQSRRSSITSRGDLDDALCLGALPSDVGSQVVAIAPIKSICCVGAGYVGMHCSPSPFICPLL